MPRRPTPRRTIAHRAYGAIGVLSGGVLALAPLHGAAGQGRSAAIELSELRSEREVAATEPTRSAASAAIRAAGERAPGLRILVSLDERTLRLVDGDSTLHVAPVGVGKGTTLEHAGRSWTFATPRGRHVVRAKAENPVWVPPDWHYVEAARQHGLALAYLNRGQDVPLRDGGRLRVRGDAVRRADTTGVEVVLSAGEEIVIDGTLYVPPIGTTNRRIPDELGAYKLDLGNGYLLHGTRDPSSVGGASTHGCLRLAAADLALLFRVIPIGTPVYIY